MTEEEWLACTDPTRMLEFLRGGASNRKWRLYLCGGCRHIAHLFFSTKSIAAVEVAERFADQQASKEELDRAEWFAESPTFGYDFEESFGYMEDTKPTRFDVVRRLVELGALADSALNSGEWRVNQKIKQQLLAAAELAEYCCVAYPQKSDWWLRYITQVDWPGRWLFDCVFGNPFNLVAASRSWLTWNDGAVPKLAQVIYDDRAFDRLPLFADALEEAGCDNQEILDHCRSTGEHVRGCWVVDLILGKS